jgi:nucleotide-binding universal stress UspA family protein
MQCAWCAQIVKEMAMYKRILIPTDGSEPSQRGVLASIKLAGTLGAQVVGLTVTPEYHTWTLEAEQIEMTQQEYAALNEKRAQRILGEVARAAQHAGVGCRVLHAISDAPYEAIIAAARDQGCDLVSMASHGRRGLKGLLLGSETQKVLVHSTVPVLVHR